MLLENLLQGMTIPGLVPQERKGSMSKQMSRDLKSLFIIQNLIGEIVRLQKVIGKIKGYSLNPGIPETVNHTDQSSIARAWGVNRNTFPNLISKIQQTGTLERKIGSGANISVMTDAVKRKLVHILVKHKGDIDFQTWEEEIGKDKRYTVTPKRETIRRWWLKECGGLYIHKKSRPMISTQTARY